MIEPLRYGPPPPKPSGSKLVFLHFFIARKWFNMDKNAYKNSVRFKFENNIFLYILSKSYS